MKLNAKLQAYLDSGIYYKECCMCGDYQRIEQGMNDKTWKTLDNMLIEELKLLNEKDTTSGYCPSCLIEFKIQQERLLKELDRGL